MELNDEQVRLGLERLAGRGQGLSPKKEQTRQSIIASATTLLTERGLRRTSMEEIAERAGVSRGTLYTYAKSKEDILIKALAEEQLGQLEHWRPLLDPEAPPRVRLKRLVADAVLCFERMPLLAILVRGDDAELLRSLERNADVREAFPDHSDQALFVDLLKRSAAAAVSDERADEIASVLRTLGSVGPQLVDNAPAYGLTPKQFASTLADLILEGIG